MKIYISCDNQNEVNVFFNNLSYDAKEGKNYFEQKLSLTDTFQSGEHYRETTDSPGAMVSISYLLEDTTSHQDSLLLSLLSMLLVNGNNGYLYSILRNELAVLYFIFSRVYYFSSNPILEIQYVCEEKDVKQISSINREIRNTLLSPDFKKYIHKNLKVFKNSLEEVIYQQIDEKRNKLFLLFLLFLAKEKQIGRENINLQETIKAVKEINENDINSFIEKQFFDRVSAIAIIL